MRILRTIKSITLAGSLLPLAFSAIASATPNTSTYGMSQNGNTITVTETNSETIDTIGANFIYSGATDMVNISITPNESVFNCHVVTQPTIYSLTCTALGGVGAGTRTVAQLTFSPKDIYTAASVTASLSASSHIKASGSETLNITSLPTATYRYAVPVQSDSSDDSSASSSTTRQQKPTSTSTGSSGSSPTPTTAVDTPANIDTNANSGVKGAATSKTDSSKQTSNSHTGLIIASGAVVLVILAAGAYYWLVLRRKS